MTSGRPVRDVDVVVVGAGPAGLTTAAALARAGIGSVEVVDRERAAGGVPRHSQHLGYGLRDLHRVVSGPAYARRLIDLAVASGANLRVGISVTGWAPGSAGRGTLELETTSPVGLETVRARAVVLATGARERPRAARLVPGVRSAGIYTTGELQQAVYLERQQIGRRAVIVGAEHVSYSAAMTLDHAGVDVVAMVTDLPRQQSYVAIRAGAAMVYRFPVLVGATVLRIVGQVGQVEGVEVVHPGGTVEVIACDTVVFTGDWIADNELARAGGLRMDLASTGPVVDTGLRTSTPGVYAAGNVVHPVLTADAAALDGRAVADSVVADLRAPASRSHQGVRLLVERPLRWIAPGLVVDLGVPPPRGAFVLWTSEFRTAPRIEVHQGDRLLYGVRLRQLVPGRAHDLGASWLPRVVLDGPDLTVSVANYQA